MGGESGTTTVTEATMDESGMLSTTPSDQRGVPTTWIMYEIIKNLKKLPLIHFMKFLLNFKMDQIKIWSI